jgi:hypothetical protein
MVRHHLHEVAKWPGLRWCLLCGDHVDFGQKVWWAQLKLSTGRLGWVKMATDDFEAIDLLAGKDGGLLGSVQFAGNDRTQRVSRGRLRRYIMDRTQGPACATAAGACRKNRRVTHA